MNEQWRDVVGHEGRYQVSDHGRVRGPSGKVLKAQKINSGYMVVHFSTPEGRRVQLVHRLVAAAFCTPGGPEVNHDDLDKTNNRATNLEWTTRKGNDAHARANGRAPESTAQAVIGTPVAGGPAVRYASQMAAEIALCGRRTSAVHHCLVGLKKTAYGHTWARA